MADVNNNTRVDVEISVAPVVLTLPALEGKAGRREDRVTVLSRIVRDAAQASPSTYGLAQARTLVNASAGTIQTVTMTLAQFGALRALLDTEPTSDTASLVRAVAVRVYEPRAAGFDLTKV